MESSFNPFTLSGKTILVTGASSGIGRAVAVQCSLMGAKIIATGRNGNRLQDTLSMLAGEGHAAVIADLSTDTGRLNLIGAIPKLDGVVHCAGIGQRVLCKAVEASDISDVMDINFSAAVLLQSALLSEKKINKEASIIFMSSRAAAVPSIANSLYSASKAAIESYSRCLSLELAARKVRVNCICPAMVWTDLIISEGATKEQLEEAQKQYPLGRYGSPEDIANLAIFLLSDASSWMTGSSIDITGGSITL